MRFRELERLIVADGWIRCDVKGSHYQYRHPLKKGKVTIPRRHSVEGRDFRAEAGGAEVVFD